MTEGDVLSLLPSTSLEGVDCARYDPATGEILETAHMSREGIALCSEQLGYAYIEGTARLHLDFVDLTGAEPAVRPCQACPVRQNGHELHDLPQGARIRVSSIEGEREYLAEDDAVEISFDHPGTYRVDVKTPGFLTGTFEMIAS